MCSFRRFQMRKIFTALLAYVYVLSLLIPMAHAGGTGPTVYGKMHFSVEHDDDHGDDGWDMLPSENLGSNLSNIPPVANHGAPSFGSSEGLGEGLGLTGVIVICIKVTTGCAFAVYDSAGSYVGSITQAQATSDPGRTAGILGVAEARSQAHLNSTLSSMPPSTWSEIAPRVGLTYDVTGDGSTALQRPIYGSPVTGGGLMDETILSDGMSYLHNQPTNTLVQENDFVGMGSGDVIRTAPGFEGATNLNVSGMDQVAPKIDLDGGMTQIDPPTTNILEPPVGGQIDSVVDDLSDVNSSANLTSLKSQLESQIKDIEKGLATMPADSDFGQAMRADMESSLTNAHKELANIDSRLSHGTPPSLATDNAGGPLGHVQTVSTNSVRNPMRFNEDELSGSGGLYTNTKQAIVDPSQIDKIEVTRGMSLEGTYEMFRSQYTPSEIDTGKKKKKKKKKEDAQAPDSVDSVNWDNVNLYYKAPNLQQSSKKTAPAKQDFVKKEKVIKESIFAKLNRFNPFRTLRANADETSGGYSSGYQAPNENAFGATHTAADFGMRPTEPGEVNTPGNDVLTSGGGNATPTGDGATSGSSGGSLGDGGGLGEGTGGSLGDGGGSGNGEWHGTNPGSQGAEGQLGSGGGLGDGATSGSSGGTLGDGGGLGGGTGGPSGDGEWHSTNPGAQGAEGQLGNSGGVDPSVGAGGSDGNYSSGYEAPSMNEFGETNTFGDFGIEKIEGGCTDADASDCDDGDACTTDSCYDGTCSNMPVQCGGGEICDPSTGECVEEEEIICKADIDCDDGDMCTEDLCNYGVDCSNIPINCSSGKMCDPSTGRCVSRPSDECTGSSCSQNSMGNDPAPFSTTTKLEGAADFIIGNDYGGGGLGSGQPFNFDTSFTGADLLKSQLKNQPFNPESAMILQAGLTPAMINDIASGLNASLTSKRPRCGIYCFVLLVGREGVYHIAIIIIFDGQKKKVGDLKPNEGVEPNDPLYLSVKKKKKKLLGFLGSSTSIKTRGGGVTGGVGAMIGSSKKQDVPEDQWYLHAVGYTPKSDPNSAWNVVDGSKKNVVVAVIDSGLDMTHEDSPQYVWVNEGEIPGNGIDDDKNGYIDDINGWNFVNRNADLTDYAGHGTFVAGIIAAKRNNGKGIAGINPGAVIMPVKIAGKEGSGNGFDIFRAIHYAVDNGAKVINLSYGGVGESKLAELAINYAYSRGVFVVVSSGNTASYMPEFTPASVQRGFSVGASDREMLTSVISSYGPNNAMVAPGDQVYSIRSQTSFSKRAFGKESFGRFYYTMDGTSFSSPIVAATASLMLVKNPNLTIGQIEGILTSTAYDLDEDGWDWKSGAGMLNATAALRANPSDAVTIKITDVNINKDKKKKIESVDVFATVSGSGLSSFVVEVGKGKRAKKFKQVAGPFKMQANRDWVARIIKKEYLKGSTDWIIRVKAADRKGKETIARTWLELK